MLTTATAHSPITYTVEVFTAHIPKVDEDTGEEVTIPIKVRRVLVTDTRAIGDSGLYKLTCSVRNGEVQYSTYVQQRIPQNPWQNPKCFGVCKAWYILGAWQRINKHLLTEEQATEWLADKLGNVYAATNAMAELTNGVEDQLAKWLDGPSIPTVSRTKPTNRTTGSKCSCGQPVWTQSTVGQCFKCSQQ